MATRAEKERQKAQQEKFQAILSGLLKDDDNKYCVDCDAKGPRWASWNLGIFLCIRCAGIHRNLGVHISKVKSVNLDSWTPEQIVMMMEIGNSRARAAYEANLPDNYRRPQTDSALEAFIRCKYETKKYIAKEWITPKPAIPKELLEDDKDKKKSKGKGSSVSLNAVPRSQSGASLDSQSNSKPAEPKPVAPSQMKVSTPQQPKAPPPIASAAASNTADLIGLDFAHSAPTNPVTSDAPTAPAPQTNNLLGDLDQFMSAPLSTPVSQPVSQPSNNNQVSNGGLSEDLFRGTAGGGGEESKPEKSTKDSILALYGGQQTQQPQQQYGVPAGTYVSQFDGMTGAAPILYTASPDASQGFTFTDAGQYCGQYVDPSMYYGGVYMPQQQQQAMPGMYNMQQQQMPMQQQQMPMQQPQMSVQQQQVPMQQPMYSNQMGMMGMNQNQMAMGNMGLQQQQQQQQQPMMMNQQAMYGQQRPQMQFQQMQQQMASMSMGQPAQMGMAQGQGWGGQPSGHTLSTNLWQ